jgi:hypothetical protein
MRPAARPGGFTCTSPPMDYRDDRLYRGRLACPYNQHEDAFGVVAQSAVPEIRRDRLRLVDYVDSHQQ